MAAARKRERSEFKPILGGFVPLASLWDEDDESPIFPSATSARWFVRSNRAALIEAEALAFHAGRVLVHRGRLEQLAQRIAIARAAARAAP